MIRLSPAYRMYQPDSRIVIKVYLSPPDNLHHAGIWIRRTAISMDSTEEIKLIRMLLERLERVSVDSYWAHRASGIRGGLLKKMEELEKGTPSGQAGTSELISSAFEILTRAAREKR
jgi:hypothetical protein